MSSVTHVIPQSFVTDGQIINLVTPTVTLQSVAQDGSVVRLSESVQLVQPMFTPSTVQSIQPLLSDPNLDRDKNAIYNHPLFPLMALLFEKCEQASNVSEVASPDSINEDVQVFLMHKQKDNTGLLSGNADVDNLMIKAIQVLRIHLLELEKVNELCKDFCQRYTSCLKGKLQSENLLRTESDYDQSMFDEPPKEENMQPVQTLTSSTAGGGVILQQPFQTTMAAMPTLGPGQILSGGTIYQMVNTPQGLVAQPVQIQPTFTSLSPGGQLIHGSTPLSQIGVTVPTSLVSSSAHHTASALTNLSGLDSDDEDNGKNKKSKRGVLPKAATQIMKTWLFQHIVHPYPTEDEKKVIAQQTNLTLLQVNNWFINARRRILQPMLEAGNPDQSKTKKPKPQTKPPQRFWPFGTTSSASSLTSGQKTVTASPGSYSSTLVVPTGPLITADGQIVSFQGINFSGILGDIKPSYLTSDETKDSSDTNNNSHSTDNDSNENDKS